MRLGEALLAIGTRRRRTVRVGATRTRTRTRTTGEPGPRVFSV